MQYFNYTCSIITSYVSNKALSLRQPNVGNIQEEHDIESESDPESDFKNGNDSDEGSPESQSALTELHDALDEGINIPDFKVDALIHWELSKLIGVGELAVILSPTGHRAFMDDQPLR